MVTTQYPTPSDTTGDLPVFGEETTAKHRTGTPALEVIAALRAVAPTATVPTILAFLQQEQRKQRLVREGLRQDLADLMRRQHADPVSVRAEEVESLSKRLIAVTAVTVYLGQAVAAFPSDNRDMP